MKTKIKLQDVEIPQEIIEWHEMGLATRAGKIPALDFYFQCLEKNDGNQKMAVQFVAYACGQSSMGVGITDTVFIQDQNRHGRSILDRMNGDKCAVERLRIDLARNGYKLKSDDHYISTVAKFHGDPSAIVNNTRGLSSMRRDLSQEGRVVHGEIESKAHENGVPRKLKHRLNPKLVESIRQREIKANPDLARANQRELREKIIDKHGSKVKT